MLSALALWAILRAGSELTAPAPSVAALASAPARAASAEALFHVLLALLVIIVAARACGALFRRFSQPAVVGEVIAGVALGPSLLGAISPSASLYLLPPEVAPYLGVLAQVGVILFMFLVGLELDTSLLRDKPHAAVAISHASILAPFLLGATMALWLYPRLSHSGVPFDLFALFSGVALSITAFPVLARILVDCGMQRTRLGVLALSCAAVDDVTAWCLLAIIASMAGARGHGALFTIALSLVYVLIMFAVVRPLLLRYTARLEQRELRQGDVARIFVLLLLSALATEAIGIHAIFGAFCLGALVPHRSRASRELRHKLEDLVVVLLLPAFFAFTGMRTRIGLLHGWNDWLICLAIIALACAGKLGGTYVAARGAGLERRDAASLGALMNTRGLMELVVLNLGLDLGIISETLFAMMVLMAVLTTLMTSPLLSLFRAPETGSLGPSGPRKTQSW